MLVPGYFSFSQWDQILLSSEAVKRMAVACVAGAAVGVQREWRHKASGLRTNMLICLGAAMFTMLSATLAGEGSPNKGQVASNIVQGIGFLGAGLILHTRSRVIGLTSAATVWVVAAIGMACGAGLYMEAVLATVIVFLSLEFIGLLEVKLRWKLYPLVYEVRGPNEAKIYIGILSVLDRAGYRLKLVERESVASLERVVFTVTANRRVHDRILRELKECEANDQVVTFNDVDED